MSRKSCYICRRATVRPVIVEPLLLPVCAGAECGRRAAELPARHCAVRDPDGYICGAPALPMYVHGCPVCRRHGRSAWERGHVA
jgi:hypothetical protein